MILHFKSHTRDILENHLTPHPLNYALSFPPPTALANPSPLSHSLYYCPGSDRHHLHHHSKLDCRNGLLAALCAYLGFYQVVINLSHSSWSFKIKKKKKLREIDPIGMWKSLTVFEQEHNKCDIVLGRLDSALVPEDSTGET